MNQGEKICSKADTVRESCEKLICEMVSADGGIDAAVIAENDLVGLSS